MQDRKILIINPGSTSTKIAIYENNFSVFLKTLKHSIADLKAFDKISDQLEFRKNLVLNELHYEKVDFQHIKIVMGRGGLMKSLQSGVYRVNARMKEDLQNGLHGEHASNLGGLIADEIAGMLPEAKAYIADPVVVDEMKDVARVTGHPLFERRSVFHALNQKAVARSYAHSVHKNYEDLNLIIAHLGGGISIGVHSKGHVIDVNQALDGEGPFSPERSGTLPVGDLIDTCYSGKFDHRIMKKMINGEGGYVAYFGTNDAYQVEQKAKAGDKKAQLIQEALAYQVSKYIGASAVVLKGKVDIIILTGGLAHNTSVTDYITNHVSFIAPVYIYPGEDEMKALAMNALMVLNGEIEVKEYV